MSLFSFLMLKLHSVQPIAVKVRLLSSKKSSRTTLLFCFQLLFINALTRGSSQLQTEVYKNTRHTKVWYNSTLLATILNPWSIFKTSSPFYVPKYLKALVYSVQKWKCMSTPIRNTSFSTRATSISTRQQYLSTAGFTKQKRKKKKKTSKPASNNP